MREPSSHHHLRPVAQPRPPASDDAPQRSDPGHPGLQTRTVRDHRGGVVIVDLCGDVDAAACTALASELASAADASIGLRLIVDLTGLRSLTDHGAAVLADARADVERRRGSFQVVIGAVNPAMLTIARTVRCQVGLLVHATVAEARGVPAHQQPAEPASAGPLVLASRRSRRHGSTRRR